MLLLEGYTGCFLKNAASRSSIIYCSILIKKETMQWLKKHYKTNYSFIFFNINCYVK
jgi:hypothetical protein